MTTKRLRQMTIPVLRGWPNLALLAVLALSLVPGPMARAATSRYGAPGATNSSPAIDVGDEKCPNLTLNWTVTGKGTETWHSFESQKAEVSWFYIPSGQHYDTDSFTPNYTQDVDWESRHIWAEDGSYFCISTGPHCTDNEIVRVDDPNDFWTGTFEALAGSTYYLTLYIADTEGDNWALFGEVDYEIRQSHNDPVERSDGPHSATINRNQGDVNLGGFDAYPPPEHDGTVSDVTYTVNNDDNRVETWTDGSNVYARTNYCDDGFCETPVDNPFTDPDDNFGELEYSGDEDWQRITIPKIPGIGGDLVIKFGALAENSNTEPHPTKDYSIEVWDDACSKLDEPKVKVTDRKADEFDFAGVRDVEGGDRFRVRLFGDFGARYRIEAYLATLIELTSLTATGRAAYILVEWETASEIDNAGFNLWRSKAAQGPYTKLNDALIPAEGDPVSGASYVYTDSDVVERVTYYYKLEDVDIHGVTTLHGPVPARVQPRFRRPSYRPTLPRF